MHVLMIHNEYARPSGEEHASAAIADLLGRNGHEVTWLTRSSAEIAGSALGSIRALASGVYSFGARRTVAKALDAGDYDSVQVQNLYPLFSPSILGPIRRRGLPLVMRCPNYRLFCPNGLHLVGGAVCERCLGPGRELWCAVRNCTGGRLKSLGYALRGFTARASGMILRNVHVFIVQSRFQRDRFVERGIDASRLVIVPGLTPTGLQDEPIGTGETISFVGRLSEEKGLDDFLELARARPDLPFAVAGGTAGCERLIADAPSNVEFAGFLSGEALDAFYRKTRIFVCPSKWYEGFPNVLTRAMVAGKPVVASAIGSLSEIVDDGVTGLTYPPGDVAALVDRVAALADDPARCERMGAAGRDKALADYGERAVYEQVIEAHRRAGEMARRADGSE